VVAEDTDILVLLLHHRTDVMKDIFFFSISRKRDRTEGKCINIHKVQMKSGQGACRLMLVMYALGGCDTTSALFGIGKGSVYSFLKDDKLQE